MKGFARRTAAWSAAAGLVVVAADALVDRSAGWSLAGAGLHLLLGFGIALGVSLLLERIRVHPRGAGCERSGPSACLRHADDSGTLAGDASRHVFEPDQCAQTLSPSNLRLVAELAEGVRALAERERLIADCETERSRAQAEANAARRRAAELEAAIAGISDGVVVFDEGGAPLCMNSAAHASWFGDDLDAPRDRDMLGDLLLRRPDGALLARAELPWMRALEGEAVHDERLVLTSHKGRGRSVVISALPLTMAGRISGAVAICHDVARWERSAVLEERRRLSRELHDHLSQILYGIGLGAHSLKAQMQQDPTKASAALDYIIDLADAGLSEMRTLIFDLRPEGLIADGLTQALSGIAQIVRARHGLEVDAAFNAEPDASVATKEALYRIAQEAVTNLVRHAQAGRVQLRLREDLERLTLEILDDGIGFDPDLPHPGRFGLHSMRERAQRLGGWLEVQTAPGKGVRITASLPKVVRKSHGDEAEAPPGAEGPAAAKPGSNASALPLVHLCAPQPAIHHSDGQHPSRHSDPMATDAGASDHRDPV